MFKTSIYIILLCATISVTAQKRLFQSYDAQGIRELYINSNEIFQIKISATETDQITVETTIDGETFASTLLNSVVKNGVLQITTGKTPDYIPFNDKLSAHKVMAIELEIIIPQGLDVSVFSTLASLDTEGALGQVRVDLGRGHFKGEEFRFRESATINTLSGSITIHIPSAMITAQSRNGSVVIPSGMESGAPLNLQSLDGNITVTKSR